MPENTVSPARNLASTYAKGVMERFSRDSITQNSFSKDMNGEFIGVKTVRVYEVDVAAMNDYTRSGSNRYGTPKDLGDTVQEFVMEKDRAFTFVIDKGDQKEQYNAKQAGAALRRQIREVVTPEIDKYRLRKWADGAGIIAGISEPTKSTVGSLIMDATAAMDDALVPAKGRVLYVTPTVYKLLKLCDEFTHSDVLATKAAGQGYVGEFDGMAVRKVPSSLMPANVYFLIVRKDSAISPVKLSDYKIHTDPPGYSGDLVEGRVMYDAFVKGPRSKGIYAAVASSKATAAPTAATQSDGTLTITAAAGTVYFTTDGTDPTYSISAKVYNASAKPTGVTAGTVVKAYAVDTTNGKFKSPVAEFTLA